MLIIKVKSVKCKSTYTCITKSSLPLSMCGSIFSSSVTSLWGILQQPIRTLTRPDSLPWYRRVRDILQCHYISSLIFNSCWIILLHITVENLEQPPRWHTCLLFIGLYLRPVKILNIHRLQRQPIHNKIKKEKSWLWNDSCTSQTQSFISITAVGLHSWNLTLWPFSIFHFIFKYDEKKHYLPLSVLLTAHILVRGGKKIQDRLEFHQNVVCS